MDSPVLQEIYQEGVEAGLEKGLIKDRQAVILDIVTTRFALPQQTITRLERGVAQISRLPALQHLTFVALQAVSWEEFQQALRRLGVEVE